MHGDEAARLLDEIAELLRFRGENPFKIRAYANAADTLRGLEEPLETVVEQGRVETLPGVGPAIARKIEDLVSTGRIPLHERLTAETPVGVLDVLRVPGLGPKRARAAYDALGIDSLDALETAAEDGSLAEVPGIGPGIARKVLEHIPKVRSFTGRFLGVDAREVAELLARRIETVEAARSVTIVGDVRRRMETVTTIDLVVESGDVDAIIRAFTGLGTAVETVERSDDRATVRLGGGLHARLLVVDEAAAPFALVRETGDDAHWSALVDRATERGLRLDERGLAREDGAPVACANEAGVYEALGLAPIAPELREGRGEIERHADGAPSLVTLDDLRGVIHCHTTWSDGRASIEEMARAAAERGFQYLAVCDHSRSAGYVGGLHPDDVERQQEEIAAVNERVSPFRVLSGIEVDILENGRLDLPDDTLAGLDCVVASVHSRFGLDREAQTERVCRALANPHLDILGHPSGRQLLSRPPLALDMERVLDAAAEHGAAIEINAQPKRLDLDWRWHRAAVERGIGLVITPDAHGPETIDYLEHGVGVARKGCLGPDDVLNTRAVDDFLVALRRDRDDG